jgi:hypothetical protein
MARARYLVCSATLVMGNDVTWWKQPTDKSHRNRNTRDSGSEIPGDADAADIVSRTGEEMPEVAHDDGQDEDEEGVSEPRDERR